MNKKYMFPLVVVLVLFLVAYFGVEVLHLQYVFGRIIPAASLLIFTIFFIRKVLDWSRSAVPFRIPTTCGQQESLPWIKANKIDNPFTTKGVVIRMILEIFCFRSLFRNTKCELHMENGSPKFSYSLEIFLWLAALAFHYSFLTVVLRHLRLFLEPVPAVIGLIESLDGFIQIGLPGIFLSGFVLLLAAIYLLARRVFMPQVNYISIASDYFPLFLIIAIALSGLFMRHVGKVDILTVKELTMGLVTFGAVPEGVGAAFFVHLFFVCTLLIYFPFSKLMHAGGIFFSPTRNMRTNSRAERHVNPWNYPVKTHTYDEYEDHFREKMIEAGLPVEKEL